MIVVSRQPRSTGQYKFHFFFSVANHNFASRVSPSASTYCTDGVIYYPVSVDDRTPPFHTLFSFPPHAHMHRLPVTCCCPHHPVNLAAGKLCNTATPTIDATVTTMTDTAGIVSPPTLAPRAAFGDFVNKSIGDLEHLTEQLSPTSTLNNNDSSSILSRDAEVLR